MASVILQSRGGQHGGRSVRANDQTYYCFDCDRRLTIIATSDTGVIICPICGHLVLEEFETSPSPPPPPPPPSPPPFPTPPTRSTTAAVDLDSFFPTSSDIDSDVELFDILPPPPPPPPQLYSRNIVDFHYTFDSDDSDLRLPSSTPPHPPPPVTYQRPLCPQFPDPSSLIPLPPLLYSQNAVDFHHNFDDSDLRLPSSPPFPPSDIELDELRLPLENSVPISPPHAPSRSSDASDIFYSPRDAEEEENLNQQPPPPPLLPPPPILNSWDYFFPVIDLPPSSPPNHENSSDLLPPPPPPWLMSDLSVVKMTEDLLSDWKSHQCSICIDNFEVNQMVRLTPCNHLYHSDCLLPWLDLHKSCPICRRKLSSQ